MRRDYLIAIILALTALPSGAALMVAPEYLHLTGWAVSATFWGGISLTALLLLSAAMPAWQGRTEASDKHPVLTRASQPDILLLPSRCQYQLEWDPPYDAPVHTRSIWHPDKPDQIFIPVIYLKNVGTVAAQGIELDWEVEFQPSLSDVIHRSALMRHYNATVQDGCFSVHCRWEGEGKSWTTPCSKRASTNLEFLSPEMGNSPGLAIVIPHQIWHFAAVYFACVLPSSGIIFDVARISVLVTIRWKSPDGGNPLRFRLIAIADATRGTGGVRPQPDGTLCDMPAVTGSVRFRAERVTDQIS